MATKMNLKNMMDKIDDAKKRNAVHDLSAIAYQLINELASSPNDDTTKYTEEEVRNLIFDYAQFVCDAMDDKIKSRPVGVWFDENKKH